MKKIKLISKHSLLKLFSLPLIIVTSACSSGNSSNGASGGGITPAEQQNLITIDNAGVVPVIGDNATTSLIYVHNNSDQAISGISYTAKVNTGDDKFLDSTSASFCSTIPAHQSCPLTFTTPTLSKTTAQGSALVTAHYNAAENKQHSFSQVISFSRVNDTTAKGAVIYSGVKMVSSGNTMAYGTVYIYGTGKDNVYTVKSLTSNNAGVKIIQGNITGKQISSNYVSAVEISAPTNFAASKSSSPTTSGYVAELKIVSTAGALSFNSQSNVGVVAAQSGPALVAGEIPYIDSSTAHPNGKLYITNAGNEPAFVAQTMPDDAAINITNSGCSDPIFPGGSCEIVFTVPQTSGSGSISILYNSQSSQTLRQDVIWYNNKGGTLLQMTATPSPIEFNATQGASVQIVIHNIGGYNVDNMAPANTINGGSASVSSPGPMTCVDANNQNTGYALMVGGSCSYTIDISAETQSTGYLISTIQGQSNDTTIIGDRTYKRAISVPYTANEYRPLLTILPGEINMQISDNNIDTDKQALTISNIGPAPATLNDFNIMNNQSGFLSIEDNMCLDQTLAGVTESVGGSCELTMVLGPVDALPEQSGVTNISVDYSGDIFGSAQAISMINYSIIPIAPELLMTNITTDISEGDGTMVNPYNIHGYDPDKTVTLTYTYYGSTSMKIKSITASSSPITWSIDLASSTCYLAELKQNDECVIVFKNVLADYIQAVPGGITAIFEEPIVMPEMIFSIGNETTWYQTQPKTPDNQNSTIYVTSENATITNQVLDVACTNNSSERCIAVIHQLTNNEGYPPIQIHSTMENYFTQQYEPNGDCQATPMGSIMEQTCTLASNGVVAMEYRLDENYKNLGGLTLNVLYSWINTGVVAGFNNTSSRLMIQ